MSWYATLSGWAAERRTFVVATVIEVGGSTPRSAGARLAISGDEVVGTVGGGAFEFQVIAAARALLADPTRVAARYDVHLVRDLAMCCGGKMAAFLEKEMPAPRLVVFGAGHVGTALAPMAQAAGFAVTVVDGRAEWADPNRFSDEVEVVDADPEDWLTKAKLGADDYVVVMTHDHPLDELLIRKLLPLGPRYLGLIGSRGKWARFKNRLEARGIDGLGAVRCPVGLDIGAETPGEIAVSVVAELVKLRRGGAK